jgi:hypothetical protein
MARALTRRLSAFIAAGLFLLLATANAGGYRYGVSDQAFYIPAVIHAADPETFPRDTPLIESQARLMVLDEALAFIVRTTGAPLPVLFAAGYAVSLVFIFTGLCWIGEALYAHRWATAALLAAYTLRHQITKTSANTFEGYFHPRMLAFGICTLAVAAFLQKRPWPTIALVALGGIIHPTTALWFAMLLGVALFTSDSRLRPLIAGGVVIAALGATWLISAGPLSASLVRMDAVWREAVASKDTLFPNAWPLVAWIANLGTAAVWAWAYFDRRARGAATAQDHGLAAGGLFLLAVFLFTLPLVASGLAFFVQLQISRVFWMVDFFATIYLIGAIDAREPRWHALKWVAAVFLTVAAARGLFVFTVERPERRLVSFDLDDTPWHDAMRWIRTRPVDVHVLTDPGHAWKYGSSVRVSGERDVFLEDVKDSAVAIYSRDVAARVIERNAALGDFALLTAERARALATRYDIDYLITPAPLELPVAHRNEQFVIYRLR